MCDIFSNAIQESDVDQVCQLLLITEETSIDLNLFGVVAAVAERLLYPQFVYVDFTPPFTQAQPT